MNIVNVGYDSTNYYLLDTGTTRLLVDAGWPGTLPRFVATLKRKGIALAQITHVLATHYHPDHAGLAQELKDAGARLIVVDLQVDAIPGLLTYVKPGVAHAPLKLNDNIVISTAESRAFLRGLGIDGEIISTPGHSPDSVTLVLDTGEAFTGDLHPPTLPDDTGSWAAIRALGATHVCPGHGPTFVLPDRPAE